MNDGRLSVPRLHHRMMFAGGLLMLIISATFGVLLVAITERRETAQGLGTSSGVVTTASQPQRLIADVEPGERSSVRTRDPRLPVSPGGARASFATRGTGLERRAEAGNMVPSGSRLAAAGVVGSALVIVLVGGYLTRYIARPARPVAVMADGRTDAWHCTHSTGIGVDQISPRHPSRSAMEACRQCDHDELVRLVEVQSALRRIATLVAAGAPPADVLNAVAADVGRVVGSDGARIVRYDADGTATVVAAWGAAGVELPVGAKVRLDGRNVSTLVRHSAHPARMDTFADAPGQLAAYLHAHGVRSAVGAPVFVEGCLWGAGVAFTTREAPLAHDAGTRLADFAVLAATAIATAQVRADLAASRARMVAAADQTRRRIERNLHNGIQQLLVSLALELRNTQASLPAAMSDHRMKLSAIADGLTAALEELREIARGLHPAILSEKGLGAALKSLARRSNVPVELSACVDDRLPEPVEAAAYYVVAEALANATKYAQASVVRVDLGVRDGRLRVSVSDDGIGGADPARGTGIIGLTDRVLAQDGRMTVDSPAGQGTTLRAELPIDGYSSPHSAVLPRGRCGS